MPPPSVAAFQLPKAGHRSEECEDAFALDPERGRFALSDGASESFAAGDWARRLSAGFVAEAGPWSRWLQQARADWAAQFHLRELSWYAETKLQEGAWATLLGVTFGGDEESGTWTAMAVGDSCLFHVREDGLLRAFPMRRAGDFNNQPALIGSIRASRRVHRLRLKGTYQRGDRFFLMTDALAAWFLQQYENKERPWTRLASLASPSDFEEFIAALRTGNAIRNDDVTLLCIGIPPREEHS